MITNQYGPPRNLLCYCLLIACLGGLLTNCQQKQSKTKTFLMQLESELDGRSLVDTILSRNEGELLDLLPLFRPYYDRALSKSDNPAAIQDIYQPHLQIELYLEREDIALVSFHRYMRGDDFENIKDIEEILNRDAKIRGSE